MSSNIDVHSFAEFRDAIALHPNDVFRGQTTDYPEVRPSLFRRTPAPDLTPLLEGAKELYFAAHRVDEIAAEVRENEWKPPLWTERDDDDQFEPQPGWFVRLVRRIFRVDDAETEEHKDHEDDDGMWFYRIPKIVGHGFGSSSDYDEHVGMQWGYSLTKSYHHGLLQHYGAPTPTLDIAYEANIALWFATHKFIWNASTQTARYEPSTETGVVYVMRAASKDLLTDLREGTAVPIAGLRGQRQEGGLLAGATEASPSLTKDVIAKIHIHDGVFDPSQPELAKLTQTYLFPPADEDVFYKALLESKTVGTADVRRVAAYIVDYDYK